MTNAFLKISHMIKIRAHANSKADQEVKQLTQVWVICRIIQFHMRCLKHAVESHSLTDTSGRFDDPTLQR